MELKQIAFANKAKGKISERVLQENKACPIFWKKNVSYPLIHTRAFAYQGIRNVRFFGKLGELFFFCNTRFEIRPFA